ncbi:MAG: putative metal-binding motif-containing protein [Deltaproteobacteria bacterium]|nr:putative metal-binding motif-containing protein [Deltaproteobacteria bacterium]
MFLRPATLALALGLLAATGCTKEDGGVLVQVDVAARARAVCVRVVARPAAGGPEQRTAAMPRDSALKVALYASEKLGRAVVVTARGYADCSETALPDEESAPARVTIPSRGTQTVTLSLERKVVPGDSDDDGFAAKSAGGADCDDRDPLTYPGAQEACGGTEELDRDCDGKRGCADEDCAPFPCGNDGGCVGTTCQGSLQEVCGDGVDNDADGDVDCLDDGCDGEPCNDGTACTTGERCGVGGVGARACIPSALPEDTVRCTSPPGPCFLGAGTCDPVDGSCRYDVNPDKVDQACDDGLACTVGDTCLEDGGCTGAPKVCAPWGACFGQGTCNAEDGGCEYPVVLTNTCDDGDACTLGDRCMADGGCEPASAVTCDAGPCQVSACEKATGVCKVTSSRANGLSCEDGDKCTFGDACQDGVCAGTPTVCEDGNTCTDNTCNPGTGNCDTSFNTAACSDNNPCTVGDICSAGTCTASPKVCNDNNACTTDNCNATTGACETSPAAATVKCTDNNPCTGPSGDDFCNGSGGCLAGTPKSCPVTDAQCQVSSCDTTAGNCTAVQNLANGTACSDNDACTGNNGTDSCLNGACTPGAAKNCPVMDAQCQTATCNTATGACGVQDKVNGTLCTDSDACTGVNGQDGCSSGTCTPGAKKDCSDGVACTVDGCTAATGVCTHTPDAGTCADTFSCTVDSCDPTAASGTTGCEQTPENTACVAPTCQAVVACIPSSPDADTSGCAFLDKPDGTACEFTAGEAASGVCAGAGGTPAGAGLATCIRAFGYVPSNFSTGDTGNVPPTSQPLVVAAGCTFTLDTFAPSLTATGTVTATGAACVVPQGMLPRYVNQLGAAAVPSALLAVSGLDIQAGGTLRVTGTTRPGILAVWGHATVAGTLDASASLATKGPGADPGTCPTPTAAGNGLGAAGGAGGPNGTQGGTGGSGEATNTTSAGGVPAAFTANLQPLTGGCSGGAGGIATGSNVAAASGGGGGGGLQLSVAGTLFVSGRISAAGGGGGAGLTYTNGSHIDGQGGGGGGAGGSLLLEALTLVLKGTAQVTANGGGGGGGAKGAAVGNGAAGNNGALNALNPTVTFVGTSPGQGGAGGLNSFAMGSDQNGGGNGGAGVATLPLVVSTQATTGNHGQDDQGGGGDDSAGGGGGGGLGRVRINNWGSFCREASSLTALPHNVSPNSGGAGLSYSASGGAATSTLPATSSSCN